MSTKQYMPVETIGPRIRRLLQERGFTLSDAAARLGWHPSRMSKYVNSREIPGLVTLARLAKLLDLPLPEMLDGVHVPEAA